MAMFRRGVRLCRWWPASRRGTEHSWRWHRLWHTHRLHRVAYTAPLAWAYHVSPGRTNRCRSHTPGHLAHRCLSWPPRTGLWSSRSTFERVLFQSDSSRTTASFWLAGRSSGLPTTLLVCPSWPPTPTQASSWTALSPGLCRMWMSNELSSNIHRRQRAHIETIRLDTGCKQYYRPRYDRAQLDRKHLWQQPC